MAQPKGKKGSKYYKPPETPEMTEEEKQLQYAERRSDWRSTHHQIQRIYFQYVKEHQKIPSYREIAKLSELSLPTVLDHMQNMDKELLFRDAQETIAIYSDQLILSLVNTALKGNTTAHQMLLAMGYNWNPQSGNTIVVNNTSNTLVANSAQPLGEEDQKSVEQSLNSLLEIAKHRAKRKGEVIDVEPTSV
jgi:DNA-binding transcriptional MocR family regulator